MVVGWRVQCVFFYNCNSLDVYDLWRYDLWRLNKFHAKSSDFLHKSTPSRGRIPWTFHPSHQGQTSDAVWCLSWKRETAGLLNGFIANKSMGKKRIRWDKLVPWAWLPVEGHRCNNLGPVQTSEQLNPDTRYLLQICISGQRQVFLLGRGVFQGNQSQRFLHVSTKVSTEKAYVCRACSFGRQININ